MSSKHLVSKFVHSPNDLSDKELYLLKCAFEADFLLFCRVFFRIKEGRKFILNWHHKVLAKVIERVRDGEINRLIINIPPRYGKTEMTVVLFVAWSIALNSLSSSIHLSYSDDLARANSDAVREIIKLDHFQMLWPRQLRKDTASKKRWYTEEKGGMMAASSGGQVTGFGAGVMSPEWEFSGAIIVDDPIKPEDAYSKTRRSNVNDRIPNTIRSRINRDDHPIIVIMQRLHEDDTTAFLLRGGSGDTWHHLCIPVHSSDPIYNYPADYTHAIPIEYERPEGPLWELKHNEEQIAKLREHPYTYASQYGQSPAPLGGGLFIGDWWRFYLGYDYAKNVITFEDESTDAIQYKFIFADTAVKTGEHNDFSVVQLWGRGELGIYLLDQIRGKWIAPDLKKQFKDFCSKHDFKGGKPHPLISVGIRDRFVEDKSSGSGLIQDVNREMGYDWVKGIPRDKDKVSRASGCLDHIASGRVFLPQNAVWISEYLYEFSMFTAEMSHAHDDQIDPTLDAIQHMLIEEQGVSYQDIF